MAHPRSAVVKKTITLPSDLSDELKARGGNVSAFIAAACREKLDAEARQAREALMIERCRVRYEEYQKDAEDFFDAEQEVWDRLP